MSANHTQYNKTSDGYSLTATLPKKEAVEETLEELRQEKKERDAVKKPKSRAQRVGAVFMFPFVVPFRGIKELIAKVRIPLLPKMLILFSFMFVILLIAYAMFVIFTVNNNFTYYENPNAFTNLIIFSAVIISLSIVVFVAFTAVFTSIMLSPIRRITYDIDSITAEDLSKRLKPVDTQDEFLELTNRINGLLDDIEKTFKRQESFIADASHELKTPISVVAGYANLLQRWGSKNQDILSESVEAIAREAENMRRLAEKLLLLARIGKINIQNSKFDLDKVLNQMAEGYKVVCTKHHISYIGGNSIFVNTDLNLLLELVRSLVDNAIRYTLAGGKVEISTCTTEDDAVRVMVSDTGIGISQEDLPFVFDRFFRCDRARGRETGGTGLGLTIAKSIADALGGTLEVESVVEEGTTFTFTLHNL